MWYDMAVSHALKTMENHVRADGSTFQGVTYYASNGNVKSKWTNQGYSKDSTWSRGQAWAVYGFTVAYRETGDQRFLETARKTADYFTANLPSDKVPYWDFSFKEVNHPDQPRDSSAAAIAAAGLLELSRLDPDAARQQTYLESAKAILTSLSSPAYLAEGTSNRAILLHGTRNNNDDDADSHDIGLIYGDYYFLEALLRASEPTAPPETGTVSGRVTDGATGLPLLGATITSSRGTTTTDADGQYTIADIAAGNQTITAIASGYEQAQQTAVVPPGGSVSVDFALNPVGQPPVGEPIKAITFEAGSLTGPSGADSVSGAVVRETAAPIKGTASARIPNNATGYLTENFNAEDELFVSFYLRLHARPTSDVRIAFISNGGTTVGSIQLHSSGTLRLRSGSTTIGNETAVLNVGQVYRVGLHQRAGTGANGVLEGFVALGDAPFGPPFAATTTGGWTTRADRLRFGATNGNVLDATFDDIMLDGAVTSAPTAPTP